MESVAITEKINKFMSFETFTETIQVSKYLLVTTGQVYVIATGSQRKWGNEDSEIENGTFYQIMPETRDDGFFDWYCEERMYNQFFTTIDAAVIHFALFWNVWKQLNA